MNKMILKGILIQCPETKEEVFVKDGYSFYEVYLFEDWQEEKLRVNKCPSCGKEHICEV